MRACLLPFIPITVRSPFLGRAMVGEDFKRGGKFLEFVLPVAEHGGRDDDEVGVGVQV